MRFGCPYVWVSFASWACLLAGCGGNLPERVPVSGRVLIDGQPLTMGALIVAPANERASTASIGPDGAFTLSCYEKGDGAVRGTHKVTVMASEQLSERSARWHAPKKYANLGATDLTVTIDGPTDDLVINLTWNGGKPFVEKW
jgi:hypothetical protein